MKCSYCGAFVSHPFADACGPGSPCAERRWIRLAQRQRAEIDRLKADLALMKIYELSKPAEPAPEGER